MYEEGAWPGRPYSAMLTFGIPAHCAGCPICYSVDGGLALLTCGLISICKSHGEVALSVDRGVKAVATPEMARCP